MLTRTGTVRSGSTRSFLAHTRTREAQYLRSTRELPRAGEIEIAPSNLLEASDGERLDFGAASATDRANQDRPWERSTGPKSKEGKAKVARNADKGSTRELLRALAKVLNAQKESFE